MIKLFQRGQRVAWEDDQGVPQPALVFAVHRVSCTIQLRDGARLTVPMDSLRTYPHALARCDDRPRSSLPEDAA